MAQRSKLSIAALVPFIIFILICVIFAYRFYKPATLKSVLIGKDIPVFELPAIEGMEEKIPGFSNQDLQKGKVSIVNVWASWCGPCIEEHKYLASLVKTTKAPLFGINRNDAPANAKRFLKQHGNPYNFIGADRKGLVAIAWGVHGIPETFIVDKQGKIRYWHVGMVTPKIIRDKLIPLMTQLRNST